MAFTVFVLVVYRQHRTMRSCSYNQPPRKNGAVYFYTGIFVITGIK